MQKVASAYLIFDLIEIDTCNIMGSDKANYST